LHNITNNITPQSCYCGHHEYIVDSGLYLLERDSVHDSCLIVGSRDKLIVDTMIGEEDHTRIITMCLTSKKSLTGIIGLPDPESVRIHYFSKTLYKGSNLHSS
jgi:hypothetical protein